MKWQHLTIGEIRNIFEPFIHFGIAATVFVFFPFCWMEGFSAACAVYGKCIILLVFGFCACLLWCEVSRYLQWRRGLKIAEDIKEMIARQNAATRK